jgi:hypothetical protein
MRDHDGVARCYFHDDGSTNNVIAILAGRAATEVILGHASNFGCSFDDAKAMRLLLSAYGDRWYARCVRRDLLADAHSLIDENRGAVERVARALPERGTLSGAEIDRLIISSA